jgi:hypothetical protein
MSQVSLRYRYLQLTLLLFHARFLYNNQLSGSIPSTIGQLSQLLDMYGKRTPVTNSHRNSQQQQSNQTTSQVQIHTIPATTDIYCLCETFKPTYASDISFNHLNGSIPSTIGLLSRVEIMYERHSHKQAMTRIIHALK